MIKNGKLENESDEKIQKEIGLMLKSLDTIYKNKSSDEYKMMGDITKSPVYSELEVAVADLGELKNFPKNEAADYQAMFNTLHKPLYKQMVTGFVSKPDEKNITFTALFTYGYRLLIGELSRIYSSTIATENGIVYQPDKTKNDNPRTAQFIHDYTRNLEEEYNKVLRRLDSKPKLHQEAALFGAIGNAASALAAFIHAHEIIPLSHMFKDIFKHILGAGKMLNPISYINHKLSNKYDNEVKSFKDVCKLYEQTKEAYEEYKNSPGRKSSAIEGKYIRNIKKYEIMMKNKQAKIKHYDSRAEAEAAEKAEQMKLQDKREKENTRNDQKQTVSKPTPTTSTPKPTTTNTETKPTSSGTSTHAPVDTGDLDF